MVRRKQERVLKAFSWQEYSRHNDLHSHSLEVSVGVYRSILMSIGMSAGICSLYDD